MNAPPALRLLVSVRDVDEALTAGTAGADFIDLKDPAAGALGGLAVERIGQIVAALRSACPDKPISATIGDIPATERERVLRKAGAVAACRVDYVKVGIDQSEAALPLLRALADVDARIVPVLIADRGVDMHLVDAALALDAFPAVMLDTADKRAGSLLERVDARTLAVFVERVRQAGRLAGLAGALRLDDLPELSSLRPDFAGFRSAVCTGSRAGRLDEARVRELRRLLQPAAAAG